MEKEITKNLKEIEDMLKLESEYYDDYDYESKTSKNIKICLIEVFKMLYLLEGNDNDTRLHYFCNNELKLRKIEKLFRDKTKGKKALSVLKKIISNLYEIHTKNSSKNSK